MASQTSRKAAAAGREYTGILGLADNPCPKNGDHLLHPQIVGLAVAVVGELIAIGNRRVGNRRQQIRIDQCCLETTDGEDSRVLVAVDPIIAVLDCAGGLGLITQKLGFTWSQAAQIPLNLVTHSPASIAHAARHKAHTFGQGVQHSEFESRSHPFVQDEDAIDKGLICRGPSRILAADDQSRSTRALELIGAHIHPAAGEGAGQPVGVQNSTSGLAFVDGRGGVAQMEVLACTVHKAQIVVAVALPDVFKLPAAQLLHIAAVGRESVVPFADNRRITRRENPHGKAADNTVANLGRMPGQNALHGIAAPIDDCAVENSQAAFGVDGRALLHGQVVGNQTVDDCNVAVAMLDL